MKKAIFLPTFVFLIFVAILYGLVPPLARARSLANDLQKQKAALQETKDYFANLQVVADQLDQNLNILANMAAALPTEFSLPSLMGFFQTTSAESGLLLRNFSYDEMNASAAPVNNSAPDSTTAVVVAPNMIKTISFNLTLGGQIASFENFLKNLENSSRLLDVEQINFQAPSEVKTIGTGQAGSQKGDIDFTILVKTYSY